MNGETYSKLYTAYKNKESFKVFKKWDDYEVSLPENTVNSISSVKPVNR